MPEGWRDARLGDVASWYSGGTPTAGTSDYYGGMIPWAVIADLNDGVVIETASSITEAGLAAIGGRVAPVDAVMVSMYGTIGRVGRAGRPMATNQAIAWAVVDRTAVRPEFLMLWLRHSRPVLDLLGRGATQRNINREIIRGITMPIPPLEAQNRIVDLIATVDQMIEASFVVAEKATRLATSLRSDIFGRKAPRVDLIDAVRLRRGFDLPIQERRPGAIQVIASNGPVGWHDTRGVAGPGVVTGRSGTIGRVFYVESDYWPLNTTLYTEDLRGNHPKFLRHLLIELRLERFAGGSTVPSLNRNVLDLEPVYIPDFEEQKRAASLLDAVEMFASSAEGSAASGRSLRSRLLGRLLSRQHEIPESYDRLLDDAA